MEPKALNILDKHSNWATSSALFLHPIWRTPTAQVVKTGTETIKFVMKGLSENT